MSKTKIEKLKKGKKSKGGARIGAGRKPKIADPDARHLFYAKVDEKWEMLMEKLDSLIQSGDKEIIKFIIEQRIGKAPQTIDLGNKDNQPLQVELKIVEALNRLAQAKEKQI